MTRRRWAAAALGLVLVGALVAMVWVVPVVAGPEVTCIGIDPVACNQAWRGAAAGTDTTMGLVSRIFPLTKVRVEKQDACGPLLTLQYGPLPQFQRAFHDLC